MSVFTKQLNILVVEDNPGDYFLIEEYLADEVMSPAIFHVRTLIELRAKLLTGIVFDVILLDLSLPDGSGEMLVREVLNIAGEIPVIVLTGYADKDFGVRSLSLGVADYLLKDELNSALLTKSTLYSIERRKINISLRESEKRYKELFHLNPVPMWVYDINTLQFLDINQAAIEHYGYSKEEFLKMNILQIRPKESIPEVIETINEIKNYGKSIKRIWRHLRKNGDIIYVEIEGNVIDFAGKKARLILATDITEKLAVENALKISEQRFRALVQDGADLMTIIDKDSRFRYVSPNHEPIVGYEPAELLYRNAFDFIHKDDVERMLQTTDGLNSHKSVSTAPYRFRHGKGHWVWLETTITNMVHDPAIEGIVTNSRDIGTRIEYETKLRQTNERYEAVAQATSDAIWDCDVRARKTFILGHGYHKLFGYPFVNEYLDMNFWEDHLHPEDKAEALRNIDDALRNSKAQCSSEYRYLKADGEYAYVHDRAFIIYENKQPVRILGAMQDITTRKYQESILAIEKEIYALNATAGISLDFILEKLIDDIEHLIPHSLCSIVRLKDGKTLHHIAGDAIPEAYIVSIDGMAIGPHTGSCGTAMFLGETVIVTDINIDPLWENFKHLAIKHRLKACWSVPIKKGNGEVVGSFATYYHNPKSPEPHEISFIERAANLVGVLLENREASEKVKQAKERYDIVMKATSDTIWDLDIIKDRITYNEGINKVFGYSLAHLYVDNVKEWWKKCIHPDDLKKVTDTLNEVFEKKQSIIQIEYRFRCNDGSYKYVLDRGFIVVDNDHNPVRIIGAMQNITRQKEEENRLRLLESVITNTNDSVMITDAKPFGDPGPSILYINDAFTKMTGYSREEVIGKNPGFLNGVNTSEEELGKLRTALDNKVNCVIELINYKKNGEEFWINMSVAPMADNAGEITHWIAIQRDVTDRKNKEIEREQLIKDLNSSNEDLRHFSYITSHNFKAPLSNLIGFLSIIDEIPIENPVLNQIIQGFKTSTHLLNETINDLVKILVIRDSEAIEQRSISFAEMMNKVIIQVENLIVEAGAKVETDFRSAPVVTFNETYLESILLNLLTNAVRYRSYDRPLKIRVSTKHEGDYAVLNFEDNGIGVDLERHREKMFGLYQKFHDRPDSKGMGLYLIRSQLESLGGSIDVESKVDVGTIFTLKFKIKK